MAGFVDDLKPTPFTGANFKIWQMRVTLWLTAMNVFWVSEGKSEGELTPKKEKDYSEANTIFCGDVIGVLVESLQDTYLRYKTSKEIWDTLNTEYGGSDVNTELIGTLQTGYPYAQNLSLVPQCQTPHPIGKGSDVAACPRSTRPAPGAGGLRYRHVPCGTGHATR
jgi:hypothetical protein